MLLALIKNICTTTISMQKKYIYNAVLRKLVTGNSYMDTQSENCMDFQDQSEQENGSRRNA